MKIQARSFIILSVACSFLGTGELRATGAGSSAFNFLKIETGAKAIGMGGAFAAVADDGSAPYWNPAALASFRHRQIAVSHTSWLDGVNYQSLSYIQPTAKAGTFAASVNYLTTGDIASYDNTGARLGADVSASDLALGLSYARRIGRTELGASAKFVRETLADVAATAPAFDAGLLYHLPTGRAGAGFLGRELRLALVAQNLGPRVKFTREEYPLPTAYRLGLAQDFLSDSLVLSLDGIFPSDGSSYAAAGLDYRLADWVALRAGYTYRPQRREFEIAPGFAAGIGAGNDYVSVDYAFVPYDAYGATHRLSLNCRFGRALDRDMAESAIDRHLAAARRLYRRKDLVGAWREFNNVLALDPVNAEASASLGAIQGRIGEIKVDKYLSLVKRYWIQDQLIEANELLDTVAALFPDNAEVKAYRARVETAMQELKVMRAATMFSQGLEFFNQKQYADAISIWEKVLLVSPGHAEARAYLARAKDEMARLAEAAKKEELERAKARAEAQFSRAVRLFKERRWEQARAAFEEARPLLPGNTELERYLAEANGKIAGDLYRRGQKCYGDKKYAETIKLWEEAARCTPGDPQVADSLKSVRAEFRDINVKAAEEFNRQGLKEYGLGNLDAAVELWEKALEHDPDNAKIRNNLARAKEERERKK